MDRNEGSLVEMVKVTGGAFTMGSPEDEPKRRGSNETQHSVTVSSFSMSKYEITQEQYANVTGYNPSYFEGVNLPIETVTWYDAVVFCNKLSVREGLEQVYTVTGIEREGNNIIEATVTVDWGKNGYYLPTEAEWEYACRAGTTTPFNTGNNITTGHANYDGNYPYNNNAEGIDRRKTTPVGSFGPNAWGLYDMHGNVLEWCWDRYDENYYSVGPASDPKGPVAGTNRIVRGGSWYADGQYLRSAYRYYFNPGRRLNDIGFRIARPCLSLLRFL